MGGHGMSALMLDVAVDLTNEDYHRLPSLSSSGARKLLPPSCPALFKWERDHPVHKDVFDFGSAAHKMVLGDGTATLEVIDAPDWRTKAAKDLRDLARAEGRIPLLVGDYAIVEAMAYAVTQHPVAGLLFDPSCGKPERSLFWTDDLSGVPCRVRLDWLPDPIPGQRMVIPDLKTARSAHPGSFGKTAMAYGYHQQNAFYVDAVIANGLDDDPAFVFVLVEKEPPYLVSVVELDPVAVQIGRLLNRKAINLFADCLATDTWPGYSPGVELIQLPTYYTQQFSEDLYDYDS